LSILANFIVKTRPVCERSLLEMTYSLSVLVYASR